MKKIYLKKYILSFKEIVNLLKYLENKYTDKFKFDKLICKTSFNYNVNSYTIGTGKNHVLLIGGTHGCEMPSVYFILEFILTLLKNDSLYNQICSKYTFHFIPLLNPEGYIISSSNVLANINSLSNEEIESIASKYFLAYEQDDYLALQGKKIDKKYTKILKSSINNIEDYHLKSSIKNILRKCNLNDDVLPIWSSNGLGIDLNSNSIHKFKNITRLRNKCKYAKLRYNDIPVNKPSPMSYPGKSTFEKRVPENLGLYKYIKSLYNLKNYSEENLISIFSYHSTGEEIYGFPDLAYASKNQIELHASGMLEYIKYTHYTPVNEKLKFGVMDYYRVELNNVCTLTIELTKNANPIGFLSNINNFEKEIINNKKAVIATINTLSHILK